VNFAQGELVMAGGYAALPALSQSYQPDRSFVAVASCVLRRARACAGRTRDAAPPAACSSARFCVVYSSEPVRSHSALRQRRGRRSSSLVGTGPIEIVQQSGIVLVAAILILLQFVVFSRTPSAERARDAQDREMAQAIPAFRAADDYPDLPTSASARRSPASPARCFANQYL
jgi:branched-subunit amino acid ABC-type transport system permease component